MLEDETLVCDRARLNVAVQVSRVRAKRLSTGTSENCLQTAQVHKQLADIPLVIYLVTAPFFLRAQLKGIPHPWSLVPWCLLSAPETSLSRNSRWLSHPYLWNSGRPLSLDYTLQGSGGVFRLCTEGSLVPCTDFGARWLYNKHVQTAGLRGALVPSTYPEIKAQKAKGLPGSGLTELVCGKKGSEFKSV